MSLVRICWFGLVLALSTQWLPAAAQASAFPLFARNSFCTTLYDEPLKRLERVFVENKTPRKEQDAERASLNRKVLELLSIIDATPPDKLGAHKRLGSESLVEDFGNDFDGGLMVALIQCFAQEKERLATVLVQNIGGVELELRGSDEPTCYTVTARNRTGRHVDAFVRLSISNQNQEDFTELVRDPTAWAGVPVSAVMTRPDGVVTQFSATQYFENLTPAGEGSSKSIAIRFAIDSSERRSDLFKSYQWGRSVCYGIRAWLPPIALRWQENIVGRSIQKAEEIAARRKAEDVEAIERNQEQRQRMEAKTKAFVATPRGAVLCRWYKKPEEQYSCMRRACSSKAYQDEPVCAMPD